MYDKKPLVFNPDLAVMIGLHEAIVLQQIHYWAEINKKRGRNFHNGRHWVKNSIAEWCRQFPFMSSATIRRAFKKLEGKKITLKLKRNLTKIVNGKLKNVIKNDTISFNYRLIITANFNSKRADRTKWYSIDYEALEAFQKEYKSTMEVYQLEFLSDGELYAEDETQKNEPVSEQGEFLPTSAQIEQLLKMSTPSAQNEQISLYRDYYRDYSLILCEAKKDPNFIKAFNDFCAQDDKNYRTDTIYWIIFNALKYESSIGDIIFALERCYDKEKSGDVAYYTGILRKRCKSKQAGANGFGKPKYFLIDEYISERLKNIDSCFQFLKNYELNLNDKKIFYTCHDKEEKDTVEDMLNGVLRDINREFSVTLKAVLRL